MVGAIRKIFGEIQFKDKASKDIDKLNKDMDESKKSMIGMAQVASVVVVAAFTALAAASFAAAKELELQTVRLEAMAGDTYPKLVASMNETIAASEGLTATGDMSTAINSVLEMGASADVLSGSMKNLQQLSEITGRDLSRVMANMARSITTGSTRFLEQNPILAKNVEGFRLLGTGYDEATKKKRELFIVDALQKNQMKIQKQYNKIVGTTYGQLKIVSTQWGNIKETIGGLIMTAFKPLIEVMAKVFRYLGETERGMAIVKTAFIALSIVVGIMFVAALKAAAVAAWALIVPLLLFILIGLAVVAVITAIVLIVDDLITMFQGGESVIGDMLDQWMKDIKPIVKIFTSIGKFIKRWFFNIINFFKRHGELIVKVLFPISILFFHFDEILDFIKSIPARIYTFFQELGKQVLNFLVGLLPEWVIKMLKSVSGAGAAPAAAAEARARGGPVTAGAPFLVGEHGPEMFVPSQDGFIKPGAGAGASISMNTLVGTINITVQNAQESAEEIESVIMDALNNIAQNVLPAEMGLAT